MRVGPYSVTTEGLACLALSFFDAQRVRFAGIPRVPGTTPKAIATTILHQNAGKVLYAGQGHFRYMWPSDVGKAIRGASLVLPAHYVDGLIRGMIKESVLCGEVTSCFNGRTFKGFNMPYARADNLPWLIHTLYEHQKRTGNTTPSQKFGVALQKFVDQWEAKQLEGGLIAPHVTGDWMDTVLRPSSTYNNVCALHMFHLLPALGLHSKTNADEFQATLLADRMHDDYLTDFAGTTREGIDAAIVALYLEVFDRTTRNTLADRLQAGGLDQPYAIRSAPFAYDPALVSPIARVTAGYHSSVWLHLGLMYINGLRLLGRDVQSHKTNTEALIMRYGNVLETLDMHGQPYKTMFHATEYGFTMAAGQYLELAHSVKD